MDAWYGRAAAILGVLSALVPALWMWGFTVDDALISLRYAQHLAAGAGYRFNALGPSTDGVTPLPWPLLVAPVVTGVDLMAALCRVKVAVIVAWAVASGVLGYTLYLRAGEKRHRAVIALVVVGLAFPIGAWAASGMETGVATALATLAAVAFDRPWRAACLAGLATALRPELLPWAMTVAIGAALARPNAAKARDAAFSAGIAALPFAICAVVRVVAFGRPAPLATLAKPSDLDHGLAYAGAAAIMMLLPLLVFAPLALRRTSLMAKTLVVAFLVHVVVVIAVGGDWMPYARLMVPVAPSLALVFVELRAHALSSALRVLVAVALGAVLLVRTAPAGRHVFEDRRELALRARPVLANARVVAALDVGWVGAVTDATVVDLAGLTDPAIAILAGGHTSKAVDTGMLLDRNVDTIVIYGEPRVVERRLMAAALFHERFALAATLPLGDRGQFYRVYQRLERTR